LIPPFTHRTSKTILCNISLLQKWRVFCFFRGSFAHPPLQRHDITARQIKTLARWSSEMATARKNCRKKTSKRTAKPDKSPALSVVTVRISDEEKGRIDEIMRSLDIERYSDMMRMALQMVKHRQPAQSR
jgi:hypothetical protein